MPGATRSILIQAPLEKVFAVITDYDRYGDFLPEVKSIRTSHRNGPEVQVHYELELIKTVRYTLLMREEPPHRIAWSLVEGTFMKENRGHWTLTPKGAGETEATYTIEMGLGALVPRAVVNALVDSSLPKMLDAFRRRAETA